MEVEWEERKKYCNYKAATIVKCLKTGEEPPRGNPFVDEDAPVEYGEEKEEEKQ